MGIHPLVQGRQADPEIIRNLSQTGITQVVVTHEVDFARKVASRVIFIDVGGHVQDGPVADALAELGEYATDIKVLGSYPVALL